MYETFQVTSHLNAKNLKEKGETIPFPFPFPLLWGGGGVRDQRNMLKQRNFPCPPVI